MPKVTSSSPPPSSPLKARILRGVIYLAGVVAFGIFVLARIGQPVALKDTHLETTGDLNAITTATHFQESLPPAETFADAIANSAPLESADILVFGDSFFWHTRGKKSVPQQLAELTGKQVWYGGRFNPYDRLKEIEERPEKAKVVVMELVERSIPLVLDRYKDEKQLKSNFLPFDWSSIKNTYFPRDIEKRYRAVLNNNKATAPVSRFLSDLQYDLFSMVSMQTPVFKDDPAWLFYAPTVNDAPSSFYYQHSPEALEEMCDFFERIRTGLKEDFGLEFIFVPVPNKYTIYHDELNDDPYNELLPQLYDCFAQRDIPTLELYRPFLNSKVPLYYRSDSHTNQNGNDLILEMLLEMLD